MAEILPIQHPIQLINQSKLKALTKFTYEGERYPTAVTGPGYSFNELQIATPPWSTTSGFVAGPVTVTTVTEGGSLKKLQIIHEFEDVHRQ